jgi:hypothetical protein
MPRGVSIPSTPTDVLHISRRRYSTENVYKSASCWGPYQMPWTAHMQQWVPLLQLWVLFMRVGCASCCCSSCSWHMQERVPLLRMWFWFLETCATRGGRRLACNKEYCCCCCGFVRVWCMSRWIMLLQLWFYPCMMTVCCGFMFVLTCLWQQRRLIHCCSCGFISYMKTRARAVGAAVCTCWYVLIRVWPQILCVCMYVYLY